MMDEADGASRKRGWRRGPLSWIILSAMFLAVPIMFCVALIDPPNDPER